MKGTKLSILFVVALALLLGVLAWLQYAWLGQISEATRERMRNRLQTDTRRFAEDFNREIRGAYFVFQIDPADWLNNDWKSFNAQYQFWQTQTAYPNLIKNFYFVRNDETSLPISYDAHNKEFVPIEWTQALRETKRKIQQKNDDVQPHIIDNYTLVMPNIAAGQRVTTSSDKERTKIDIPRIKPKVSGYLLIELDETVVNKFLSDLNLRYFSSNDERNAAQFDVSIVKPDDGSLIFPKNENSSVITKENSDESVQLFDLTIGNFTMIVNSKVFGNQPRSSDNKQKITTARIIPPPLPPSVVEPKMEKDDSVKVFMRDDKQKAEVLPDTKGIWSLNVRHTAGSLDTFIDNTRRKNLAVSFGILLLLAASVFFIFISSRRAQILAQRQMDFVSAVSHEFRTPLAVIYSAGENLTDGVIRTDKQISQYGSLIRREGKKLSAMVEQILEFAGARSGRQKYDLRETEVETIVQNAIEECRNLISEKDFQLETEIAKNLPKINADAKALSTTIQNLIVNAVKYSGENSWLKVSARNGDGQVKISVEDKGIGISSKDISNIFTPFYRAKSVVDAQIHGNGLGLSLVKQTVEAHGGNVKVESENEKGSKFTIHLPAIS